MLTSLIGCTARIIAAACFCLLTNVAITPNAEGLQSDATSSKQEPAPPSRPSRVVGSWLATIDVDGLEIQVFAMPGQPDNVVYIAPYHFVLDGDGTVLVEITPTTFADKSSVHEEGTLNRITVSLRRNPTGTRAKIAQELRRTGIKPYITDAHVNPADVYSVEVRDITPDLTAAKRFSNYSLYYPSHHVIHLDAFVTEPMTDSFVKWIKSGALRLRVTQELYGETIDWDYTTDVASALYSAVADHLKLVGPVRDGNLKEGVSPAVTRDQMGKIVEHARERLTLKIRQMGKPEGTADQLQIVEKLLEQIITPEVLFFGESASWKALNTDFFLRNGLDPSRIDEYVDEYNSLSESEKVENFQDATSSAGRINDSGSEARSGSAGGSMNFGKLFSGQGGRSSSSSSTWDRNREWQNSASSSGQKTEAYKSQAGKVFKLTGELWVPVGIEVYKINEGAFTKTRSLGISQTGTSHALTQTRNDLSSHAPGSWTISSAAAEVYAPEQIQALQALITGGRNTLATPAPTVLFRAPTVDVNVRLQRGKLSKILSLPRSNNGDVDRSAAFKVSLLLSNEAGDAVFQELVFNGTNVGTLEAKNGDCDQVEFLLLDDAIHAIIRGPRQITVDPLTPNP